MRRQTAATAQPSGASEPSNQTDGPERNQRSPGARARLPLCRRPSHGTAREAAGLPPLPFHHLRHTFATLAIRGLDPATVQTLMGHSKITTTERYLHARPLTELAERMDAIFELAPVVEQQPTR